MLFQLSVKAESRNRRVSTHFDVQQGSDNQQMFYVVKETALSRAHSQKVLKVHSSTKHQRRHCKQDKHSLSSSFTV